MFVQKDVLFDALFEPSIVFYPQPMKELYILSRDEIIVVIQLLIKYTF